jgi:hypothetical protein
MWFKVDTIQRSILFINSDGASDRVMIGINSASGLGIEAFNGSTTSGKGQNSWTDTTNWHQIAASNNGSHTYTAYIDAAAQSGGAWSGSGATACRIGSDDGSTYDFDGKIGELLLYNRVLSAPEIIRLYQQTKWRYIT